VWGKATAYRAHRRNDGAPLPYLPVSRPARLPATVPRCPAVVNGNGRADGWPTVTRRHQRSQQRRPATSDHSGPRNFEEKTLTDGHSTLTLTRTCGEHAIRAIFVPSSHRPAAPSRVQRVRKTIARCTTRNGPTGTVYRSAHKLQFGERNCHCASSSYAFANHVIS